MSRLLRPLAFSLIGLSLGIAGCRTSTPYTRMYSPRKSYYVPPVPKEEKSAEELLTATDATKPADTTGTIPGGLPPADPAAIPGLPPPVAPAADPLAPAPAVPPAN